MKKQALAGMIAGLVALTAIAQDKPNIIYILADDLALFSHWILLEGCQCDRLC